MLALQMMIYIGCNANIILGLQPNGTKSFQTINASQPQGTPSKALIDADGISLSPLAGGRTVEFCIECCIFMNLLLC